MQDERIVKLLIRRPDDTYLVLKRDRPGALGSIYSLPGGVVDPSLGDIRSLDKWLDDNLNMMLFTESATLTGEDTQYVPGEGLKENILYLLFDQNMNRYVPPTDEYVSHEWRKRDELRIFDPIWQGLVQVAIDFYSPPGDLR